jgi:hypothetical protein
MIDHEQWREAPGIGIRKQFRAPVVQDQPVVVEMRSEYGIILLAIVSAISNEQVADDWRH